MVRAASYKLLIFATMLILWNCVSISVIAQPTIKNHIAIRPAIADLGVVEGEQYTTEFNVKNSGETCTLSTKIEGNGSDSVTVVPDTFTLTKGESKTLKVLISSKTLKTGAYDYSILLLPENSDKDTSGWVSADGLTSFRLKFSKPGISIASFYVVDVEKPDTAPFHIIFANFLRTKSEVDSNIKIISESNNQVVGEFNKKVSMNPYPEPGFYGTVKIPFETTDFDMGKYLIKVDAITSEGIKLQTDEQTFKIGVLKGELVSVSIKNVYLGEKAELKVKIKNVGNLDLNTSLKAVIKDQNGEKIFQDQCSQLILPGEEKTLVISMETANIPSGTYIAEYEVRQGSQTSAGVLNFKVLPDSKDYIFFIIIGICIAIVLLCIILKYIVQINFFKSKFYKKDV